MLVQLALIAFGMFGILAAIVDMGFVRLTQVEMQVAADSAAVEGLRARDSVVATDPLTGVEYVDGFASDCTRRLMTGQLVRWTFDDNLNPDDGDPRSFGAGPNIDFTEGTGDLSALQTMSVSAVPEERSYKPQLELNQGNAVNGDMLSGTFTAGGPFEDGTYERPTYERADFQQNDLNVPLPGPGGSPPCPDAVPSQSPPMGDMDRLFLVRLRRTSNLDDDRPGISSRGTSLPLLFGRGTLIQPNPSSDYSPRRDGITVRATAIADARPALRVGANLPTVRGAVPLLLTEEFFNALAGPVSVMVNPAGLVPDGGDGRFAEDVLLMNTVAAPLPPPFPPGECVAGAAMRVFAAIYSVANLIVGFGDVTLEWSSDCSTVTITRTNAPILANGNATGPDTGFLDPSLDVQVLITAVSDFAYVLDPGGNLVPKPGVVFAPALVR